MGRVLTQAYVDAKQAREDEMYAKRARAALVSSYFWFDRKAEWQRHAYRNRDNPQFIAALKRQATYESYFAGMPHVLAREEQAA